MLKKNLPRRSGLTRHKFLMVNVVVAMIAAGHTGYALIKGDIMSLVRSSITLFSALCCCAMFALPVSALEAQMKDSLEKGCLFAYFPNRGVLYAKVDFSQRQLGNAQAVALGGQCTSVSIRVTAKDNGVQIAQVVLPVNNGVSEEAQLATSKLEGLYEVHFTLAGLPEPVTITRTFEGRHFDWENNRLGITDEIYAPFTPVQVQGTNVSVVQRRYTMNGFGLWDHVITKDRDILARPITLRYLTAAGEGKWDQKRIVLDKTTSTGQQAVFHAVVDSEAVRVNTTSTVEFDGCMKVEMHLLPGRTPAMINQLWIDIPLKDREAPLFHEMADYIRHNFAGSTPQGEGVIWDSTKSSHTAKWLNPFTSYIWLGAEERGLCWFGENDKGWITEKGGSKKPLQELIRTGKQLTLRVYLVNTPTTITAAHSMVFGLQASPTKPMAENWRAKTTQMPGGSGPVNPWGGLHCGYKGPYHNDWQIVDKIIEAQKTGIYDEAWFKAYALKNNVPPCYGTWDWVESTRAFAGFRQRPVMTYQEELIQSPIQPEWLTFQDEWRDAGTLGTEMSVYTRREWPTEDAFRKGVSVSPAIYITHDDSYQDFGCWYANEWFKRGIGAYWDNTFPKYTYNYHNSASYRTADGQVQPAMVIWNERTYMKRIWNLLQYWRRHQADPLEWSQHMTNALILPLNTWATVVLDYEQSSTKPFSVAMHRAEALGRQVGAIPYWLYTPTGKDNKLMLGLMKQDPHANDRADWGMKMVHEALRTEYTGQTSLKENERVGAPELEQIVVDFGYTQPATHVFNYWDEHPVLNVDQQQVKWIAMTRPNDKATLLVLQSWSETAVTVKVTLNTKALGLASTLKAVDAETGVTLPMTGHTVNVELTAPYGVRLLKFQ